MSLTKTGVLLSVIVFYALIFVGLSFYGSTLDNYGLIEDDATIVDTENPYANIITEDDIDSGTAKTINKFPAFKDVSIVKAIVDLPGWLNAIIFTPLFVILLWVILTSFIPTLNGGG